MESTVLERISGRGGLSELREPGAEIVDVPRNLGVVFVLVEIGSGRMNSLWLKPCSALHGTISEAAYEESEEREGGSLEELLGKR